MRIFEEIRRRLGFLWKRTAQPIEEYQRPAFQGPITEANTIQEGDDVWTLYNPDTPTI